MSHQPPASPRLILIRGLPGSGKSTLARRLAQVGWAHHEADHFFDGPDGYAFDALRLKEAHAQCLERTRVDLAAGRDVVVANTFTCVWEMQPYIDLAREVGARLAAVTAQGAWSSVHGVPPEAIERMRERWEPTPAGLEPGEDGLRPSAT